MKAKALNVGSGLLLAAALSGCASFTGPTMRQATHAMENARSTPEVRLRAALELSEAESAYERALEAAASLAEDPAFVDHLFYMARQRAIIAVETARLNARQTHARTAPLHTGGATYVSAARAE